MKTDTDTLQTPLVVARGTLLAPGKMYLRLYHGRTDPDREMEEWGFAGPTFGPLSSYVHVYCRNFRLYDEDRLSEVWLETHGDMIRWDGCFYGDMRLFIADDDERA